MVLDVKHNTWSPAASLPSPLRKPLVAAVGGRIFTLPAYSCGDWILSYDPLTNTHAPRAHLPGNVKNTQGACLVGVNNNVYLLGGVQSLAWQYNPHSDHWVQLASPNLRYFLAIRCCGVAMKSGNILVCGGSTEKGKECNMIEEYNHSNTEWKTLDICLPFGYKIIWSHVTSVRF